MKSVDQSRMMDRYGTPSRPDDIPEAVWNSCWWAQAYGLQEAASRQIMAAKAEEREECAAHLESEAKALPLGHESVQRGRSTYNWLAYCACLIRNREEEE